MSDHRSPGTPLHKVYTTLSDERIATRDPIVQKLLREPHLGLFVNGDWVHILPGMILGLITDPTQVDGIAPYVLKAVKTKPGKERIDLIAWTSDRSSTRELKLGAKYTGQYVRGLKNADDVVEAAIKTQTHNAEGGDFGGGDNDGDK